MAFPFKIILVEQETQSVLFVLTHFLVFIYVFLSVVKWPYTLFYLVTHLAVFSVINKRLSAGRLYTPTKNLNEQTVVVTGAVTGIGRATALQLARLPACVIVGICD
jgi:hypothetical protein